MANTFSPWNLRPVSGNRAGSGMHQPRNGGRTGTDHPRCAAGHFHDAGHAVVLQTGNADRGRQKAVEGDSVYSLHREENIDDETAFLSLMNAVNAAAETYGMPVVLSVHPRSFRQVESRGFESTRW